LFAFLQGNVGHLPRRGVDLIERPWRKRIDLNGIDVAVAGRLHAGSGVGLLDALAGIAGFRLRLGSMQWLELSRQRQQLWHFDDFDRFWRIGKLDGRLCVIVVGNLRRGFKRNGATRDHRDRKSESRQCSLVRLLHCQNSFDQLMALT
jgi:hypothetical protein